MPEQTYSRLINFFMTQEAELAWMKERTGLSASELVRRAVDQLYEKLTEAVEADEESKEYDPIS
jgi:hypothetical protein